MLRFAILLFIFVRYFQLLTYIQLFKCTYFFHYAIFFNYTTEMNFKQFFFLLSNHKIPLNTSSKFSKPNYFKMYLIVWSAFPDKPFWSLEIGVYYLWSSWSWWLLLSQLMKNNFFIFKNNLLSKIEIIYNETFIIIIFINIRTFFCNARGFLAILYCDVKMPITNKFT